MSELELERRFSDQRKGPQDKEDPSAPKGDEVPRAVGKSTLVEPSYRAASRAVHDGELAVGKRTLVDDVYAPRGRENLMRYEALRVRGLRELLDVVAVRGSDQLVRSMAASAESGIASRARVWNGRSSDRSGRALARAAERHAATLYRHAADSGEVDHDDPSVDEALARAGRGQGLADELRQQLERELGYALHRVRIHTDGVAADAARAIRAQAFTVGEDIFFAHGAFAPETREGKKLLAHELTHVVQAWEGRTRRGTTGIQISDPGESLEREADSMAERLDLREKPRRSTPSLDAHVPRAGLPTPSTLPQIPRAAMSTPWSAPLAIPRMLLPLAPAAISPRPLIAPAAPSSGASLILRRPDSTNAPQKVPSAAAPTTAEVIALAGRELTHGGYGYVVTPSGAFRITSRSDGGRLGSEILPTNRGPWTKLAIALRSKVAPVAPTVAAPPPLLAAPTPTAPDAEDVAAPAPIAEQPWSWSRLVDVITSRFHRSPSPVAAATPAPAKPSPGTAPTPQALPLTTAVVKAPIEAKKKLAANASSLSVGGLQPGMDTLSVASTRLGKTTTYHLPGVAYSADEKKLAAETATDQKALKATVAAITAANKVLANKKASKADKDAATAELPKLQLLKTELDERLKARKAEDDERTANELDSFMTGSDDATEFWCSGLSIWTLAHSGFNPAAELLGAEDRQPFQFRGRTSSRLVKITLKRLIDGEGEAVEAATKIQQEGLTKGATVIELTGKRTDAGSLHRGAYGATGISDAVKGAAGAFKMFGIGIEVPIGSQKPGDFAQRREATKEDFKARIKELEALLKATKEEAEKAELEAELADLVKRQGTFAHVGKGHAWQVSEVEASGAALFGAPGSPRLLGGGRVPAVATWLTDKKFVIDRTTQPELVGPHTVTGESKIEANTPGSQDMDKARVHGGVQQTKLRKSKDEENVVVFYGRLNVSPWAASANHPASEDSARAFLAGHRDAPVADPVCAAPGASSEAAASPSPPPAPTPATPPPATGPSPTSTPAATASAETPAEAPQPESPQRRRGSYNMYDD